jgi:hypothetical protein
MSEIDPIVQSLKGVTGGLNSVLDFADEADATAKRIAALGKQELAARAAWRRKEVHRNGDYAFIDATEEYKRVREALDLKDKVKAEFVRKYGPASWYEVESIIERQAEEKKKLFTEDGHDRKALFMVKLYCFLAAGIITFGLWLFCFLPMEVFVSPLCGG